MSKLFAKSTSPVQTILVGCLTCGENEISESKVMPLTLDSIANLRLPTLQGAISNVEAYFLYNIIKTFKPKTVCEVGVASGWSTAIVLKAINELISAEPDEPYRYSGIDNASKCYYDNSLEVGYVTKLLLDKDQYFGKINIEKDLTYFGEEFKEKEIDLLFIDANHHHPCPSMDLLAALPYLKDNAIVALHDTNLPIINPDFPLSGAKFLFDGVNSQFKFNCPALERNNDVSNMGAFFISDKTLLKQEIIDVILGQGYETELHEPYRSMSEQLQSRKVA